MNKMRKRKLDRIDLIEAGINPLVCCISGGGGSSTSTQKADPWEGVQPYLLEIFGKGQDLQESNPWGERKQAYNDWLSPRLDKANLDYLTRLESGGDFLLGGGLNPETTQLQAGGLGAARQSQGDLDPTSQLSTILGGGQVNPYLQSMNQANINDSLRGYQDSMDMLTQNMLPNVRSGAVAAGQYGGSRQGIAEGLVGQQAAKNARDLGISAMDSGNQLYGNAYQQMTDQQYNLANNLNNQAVGYEQFGKGLEQMNNQNALENSKFGLGQMLAGNQLWGQANQIPMQHYQQQMGLLDAKGNYDWDQLNRFAQIIQPGTNFQSSSTTQSQKPGAMETVGSLGSLGISAYLAFAL